jgi:UDP-N-acetylmuramoylalanine--D-glutamate ligase
MKKKVIILGFGVSGRAASLFLLKRGYEVFVVDRNVKKINKEEFLKKNIHFFDEDEKFDFSKFSFLVLSSGIKNSHPIVEEAKKKGLLVLGEMDIGFLSLKGVKKCIGITGTNGKTTVVSLIEFVLNENGIKAVSVGNIGKSLCEYVLEEKEGEVLIVEVSSFQLSALNLKVFDMAVILNITLDHLDWHLSFEDYVKSKLNIQNCLKGKKLFVSKAVFKSFNKYLKKDFLKIFDWENFLEQNLLAAFFVVKEFSITFSNFMKCVKKFKKLKYRMEFLTEIREISFYNDSKSTNAYSTIYAVKILKDNVILIAGGADKGLFFEEWKKVFKGKVKSIFLIGSCAKRMEKSLFGFDVEVVNTLQKAVEGAYKKAGKGDKILLSPGCSSFDQFDDYKHRGNEFKKYVSLIEKREKLKCKKRM